MRVSALNSSIACCLMALASSSSLPAQVSLSITVGPPPIPMYEQPICPEDGYTWTPGYWAWGDEGYFWVPGTWIRIPEVGMLWTPGYWGWSGRGFIFHTGYWGPHVGFYGGINYGHGYGGYGYEGAHWQGRHYYYNRAVTNVDNTRITNIYNKTVIVNNTRVAYNGGEGGLRAAPTPKERSRERERHVAPTTEQTQHFQSAGRNKELLASTNRGAPPVAATVKPADFSPKNVVPAKAPGGHVNETALKATPKTLPPSKDRATGARPTSPNQKPQANTPRSTPRPTARPTPRQDRSPSSAAPQETPKPREIPSKQPLPQPPQESRIRPNPTPNRGPAPSRQSDPSRPDRPGKMPSDAAPRPKPSQNQAPEPQRKPGHPREKEDQPKS